MPKDLTAGQRGHVRLGRSPDDKLPPLSSASDVTQEYFWVGVDVVQIRNIREKKGFDEEKNEQVVEYIYPEDPEKWVSPILLVLQRTITMPPLGESLLLNDFTAQRLLEQLSPGSLITSAEGGQAVARDIKEQIEKGVSLLDLTKGELTYQRHANKETAAKALAELSEEEVLQLVKDRGVELPGGDEKNNKKNTDAAIKE